MPSHSYNLRAKPKKKSKRSKRNRRRKSVNYELRDGKLRGTEADSQSTTTTNTSTTLTANNEASVSVHSDPQSACEQQCTPEPQSACDDRCDDGQHSNAVIYDIDSDDEEEIELIDGNSPATPPSDRSLALTRRLEEVKAGDCAICIKRMVGIDVIVLECGHVYHPKCILEAARMKTDDDDEHVPVEMIIFDPAKGCPLCKQPLTQMDYRCIKTLSTTKMDDDGNLIRTETPPPRSRKEFVMKICWNEAEVREATDKNVSTFYCFF